MSSFRRVWMSLLVLGCHAARSPSSAPETRRAPVLEARFDVELVDPYRWMEAPDSAEFRRWLDRQDRFTSDVFRRMPGFAALRRRVAGRGEPTGVVRNPRRTAEALFYLRSEGGPATLYRRSRGEAAPAALGPFLHEGAPRSLAGFEPDPSGSLLALSTAGAGGEPSILVVRAADGVVLEALPGGTVDAAWLGSDLLLAGSDGSWRLHTPGDDPAAATTVLGAGVDGVPDMAGAVASRLRTSANSPLLVALVAGPGASSFSLFVTDARRLRSGRVAWRRLAGPEREIEDAFPHEGSVVVLSTCGGKGRCVLEYSEGPAGASPAVIVPPDAAVLERIAAARDGLYLLTVDDVRHGLLRMDWRSKHLSEVALPFDGSIRGPIASPSEDHVLVGIETWDRPVAWYEVGQTPVELHAPRVPGGGELVTSVVRARSFDGTPIPISIVRGRATPGAAPLVWVMAYGGYGIPQTPRYLGGLRTFLDDGGVYAVAHVRGGGEFGTSWHHAGRGARKPNTYKDLIACVEHLVDIGVATPGRIAVEGASGGGPVVGMLAMKRPELARVVFDRVGDNNTLRLHVTPDAPYMIDEWGDPATPEGFEALRAMDVTWHVRPGVRYPAFYLTAGGRDTSVPPWMPGKLAAHLQRHSPRPALLRVDREGGHIASNAVMNEQLAEQMAFFYWQTGREGYQPAR
jgi:prolyl oligopeptidase